PGNLVLPEGVTGGFDGNTLNLIIANLAPGTYVTISYQADIAPSAADTTIANTATVRCDEYDLEDEDTERTTATQGWRQMYLIGHAGMGYPRPIRPFGNITRAEVATIFFRMVTDDVRAENWMQDHPYSDVALRQWFNNAIATTTNMGLFEGVGDDRFAPTQYITRGELAAVLVRFMERDQIGQFSINLLSADDQFNDIANHWAREYINEAARQGWVEGPSGLGGPFNPRRPITRAETAAMINRMFGRLVESTYCLLDGMVEWPDNQNEARWYFVYMQMATNSYTYRWRADSDRYKELLDTIEPRAWERLERPHSTREDNFNWPNEQ
ncbi:MAG: S-layer homology domain-containing protein, partial [Oscillospiraceae bacterium]|nr:S-layer homology domain-containing protein [Oscillospiraceae bacterium]